MSDNSSFEEVSAPDRLDELESLDAETAEPEEWQDVLGSGALLRKVLRKGAPDDKPLRSDVCTLNLVGRLADGATVFEEKEGFEMQLGDAETVQGVDLVVALMERGEKCQIRLAPRLGYGEVGMVPSVPPYAELVYDVELVDFRPEPEMETLTVEQRREIGNRKRERGNWWYSMREFTTAIQCYRRAIEYLDESEGGITDPTPDGSFPEVSDELHSLLEDRIKTYNNMAAAQLKQGSYEAALASVELVLTCQPNNVKALFRKGKIMAQKNDIPEAIKAVKRALNLSSGDKAIKGELFRLEEREKKENVKERNLARKMLGATFGEPSKKDSSKDRPKRNNRVFIWGTILFSIAIGAIGIVLYKYKLI